MKHIKLYENFSRPIISYDFDGVLHRSVSGIHPHNFLNWRSWEPFEEMFEQMKKDAEEHDIVVVTARPPIWEVQGAVNSYIAEHDLPVTEVYYTDNMPKLPILKRIGAIKHYDDNPRMTGELRGTGIEFQLVDPKIFESFALGKHDHELALKRNKEYAKKYDFMVQGDYVVLFHGTSKKNMKAIQKSGMLRQGTWMTPNLDVAKKYARQTTSSAASTIVDTFVVYLGSLTYSPNDEGGYFQSNEELHFKEGKYVPQGFKKGPDGDIGLHEKEEFRDAHVAPTADDRAPEEKLGDAGGTFSLTEVVKGFHNQPDDYFSNPRAANIYQYGNTAGRESSAAIGNFIRYYKAHGEMPDRTITAYRAVPNKVTAAKLAPGDWVSFSKTYAEEHGERRFGDGEYRIIKQEVSPDEVWWDSNDIKEWGFDDSVSEDLNEMMDGYQENGIVLIKGNELPNGKFRLYGAHIKKVLSYQRMKMGGEEGQAARMVLLYDDLFRIKVVDRKLVAGKTMEKFNRTGVKSNKIVLNNNKTPIHWLSTKYRYFPQLFKELVAELRNMSDIEWYN